MHRHTLSICSDADVDGPHPCSELSAVSESDMDDWWLVTLIVVASIVAVALLVYLGVEWAAGT
jgi:hypothetical protein